MTLDCGKTSRRRNWPIVFCDFKAHCVNRHLWTNKSTSFLYFLDGNAPKSLFSFIFCWTCETFYLMPNDRSLHRTDQIFSRVEQRDRWRPQLRVRINLIVLVRVRFFFSSACWEPLKLRLQLRVCSGSSSTAPLRHSSSPREATVLVT